MKLRTALAYLRSNTFLRLSVSFLTILGASILIIGLSAYGISRASMLRNAVDNSRMNASSIMEQVDQEITNLHHTVLGILTNEDLSNFEFYEKNGTPDALFKARDMARRVAHLQNINPSLRQILLYSLKTQTVISSSGCFSAEEYFGKRVRMETLAGPDILEAINAPETYHFQYLCTVDIDDPNFRSTCLTFVRSIASHTDTPNGQILLNVDRDVFGEILGSAAQQRTQTVLLMDATGGVLCSTANAAYTDGEYARALAQITADEAEGGGTFSRIRLQDTRYSGFVAQSGATNLRCLVLIEDAVLFADIDSIRMLTVIVLALCLGISVCITFAITRKVFAPIRNILLYIKAEQAIQGTPPSEAYKDIYLIETFLAYMKKQNAHLQARIESYDQVMRETLLTELLYAFDPRQTIALLNDHGISSVFPHPLYTVATIPLYTMARRFALAEETLTQALDDLLAREPFASSLVVHVLKFYDRIVLILNARKRHPAEAINTDFIDGLKQAYAAQTDVPLLCAYGKTCDTLSGIHDSFHQAMNVLAAKSADMPQANPRYDRTLDAQYITSTYTKDQEVRLIQLIKSGANGDAVLSIVNALIAANDDGPDASSLRLESLFVQLIMTINRVIAEMNLGHADIFGKELNHYRLLDRYPTPDGKKAYILGALDTLLRHVRTIKANKSSNLYQQMLAYVADHYSSSNISLNQISYELNLSASYLSNIFKEYHHGNFLDYLNAYRVGQAKRLLVSSTLPVHEIAERVGCSSANTFIRIFKKAESVTPGQYRLMRK